MKFRILGTENFLRQFLPILPSSLPLKNLNYGQNNSLRAEKMSMSLFLNGESEKIGPETICWHTTDSKSLLIQNLMKKFNWKSQLSQDIKT